MESGRVRALNRCFQINSPHLHATGNRQLYQLPCAEHDTSTSKYRIVTKEAGIARGCDRRVPAARIPYSRRSPYRLSARAQRHAGPTRPALTCGDGRAGTVAGRLARDRYRSTRLPNLSTRRMFQRWSNFPLGVVLSRARATSPFAVRLYLSASCHRHQRGVGWFFCSRLSVCRTSARSNSTEFPSP